MSLPRDGASEPQSPKLADPDIVGIGAIISFLIAAVIVVVSVLLGYICHAWPEASMNCVDKSVIEWTARLLARFLPARYLPVSEVTKRRNRQARFERLMLALSDQQLVVGLSISTAVIVSRDISIYSFSCATSLAWLSCVIHLSTLMTLSGHLIKYPYLLLFRRVGMLAVVGLLLGAMTIDVIVTDPPDTAMFPLSEKRHKIDFESALCVMPAFGWVALSYVHQISEVLIPPKEWKTGSWPYRLLLGNFGEKYPELRGWKEERESFPKEMEGWDKPKYYFLAWRSSYLELCHSGVWKIILMLFGFTFGLVQFVLSWKSPGLAEPVVKDMSFGQIESLCLSILPIIAVMEVLSGKGRFPLSLGHVLT